MIPSLEHFATHGQSEYPHLWEDLLSSMAPCLGVQGSRLQDFSGRGNFGTLVSMDPPTDWLLREGRYSLDFDGLDDAVDCGTGTNADPLGLTISAWVS